MLFRRKESCVYVEFVGVRDRVVNITDKRHTLLEIYSSSLAANVCKHLIAIVVNYRPELAYIAFFSLKAL
jgi:hypothetical protein